MTEFLNTYAGWLSLVAIIVSIPLGILANLATPKLQAWFAMRSNRALQGRIVFLERLVKETDRIVSEPPYAVARFVSTAFTALLGWIMAGLVTTSLGIVILLIVQ